MNFKKRRNETREKTSDGKKQKLLKLNCVFENMKERMGYFDHMVLQIRDGIEAYRLGEEYADSKESVGYDRLGELIKDRMKGFKLVKEEDVEYKMDSGETFNSKLLTYRIASKYGDRGGAKVLTNSDQTIIVAPLHAWVKKDRDFKDSYEKRFLGNLDKIVRNIQVWKLTPVDSKYKEPRPETQS